MTSRSWFFRLFLSCFRLATDRGGIVMYPSFRILPKKLSLAPKVSGRVIVTFRVWVGSSLNCSRMIFGTLKRLLIRKYVLKFTC